jgi:hypothetical protein
MKLSFTVLQETKNPDTDIKIAGGPKKIRTVPGTRWYVYVYLCDSTNFKSEFEWVMKVLGTFIFLIEAEQWKRNGVCLWPQSSPRSR